MNDQRPRPIADPTATVSPSKLDCWTRCQWQWFARYVLGMRKPPSASMAWGNAYDGTANDVYREKIATGETPKPKDACERYAAHWDTARAEVEDWDPDANEDPALMLDQGVELTALWHKRAARFVKPKAVQVSMSRIVNTPGGDSFEVLGFADLIHTTGDGSEEVVDNKAGKKAWGTTDLYRSTQAIAYPFMSGQRRFAIHNGIRPRSKTGKPNWKAVSREVTDSDAATFATTAAVARRQMQHAIQTGDFLPNRTGQLCGRRWCGFWRECEQANGGRVAP